MDQTGDRDYIVRLIQYLDIRHGVRFFITTRDFDTLYRWWEKGVPLSMVCRSIDTVMDRRSKKSKETSGFSVFSRQVRKNYQEFLQIKSQDERRGGDDFRRGEIDEFLADIPVALADIGKDIREYFDAIKNGDNPDVSTLEERLLDLFHSDSELNSRSDAFMQSLAPPLRKEELRRRYRINYLLRKWRIPI